MDRDRDGQGPGRRGAVEGEIWAAIERLQADGVSAEALADIRSRFRYGFLSDLTTPDDVAQNLARFVAITGGIDVVDELFATLDAVTPEDVSRPRATTCGSSARPWPLSTRRISRFPKRRRPTSRC